MEISESAQRTINSLKTTYKIKGSGGDLLLNTIGEALTQIEMAKKQMENDSGQKGLNVVFYGFMLDRFGEPKQHPGNTMIKDASNRIISCIKQLGIQIERGNAKKMKQSNLTAVLGGNNKSA